MTTGPEVAEALSSVPAPAMGGYDVARLPSAPEFRVGRGADGSVVLLTPPERQEKVGAPVRLRRITVHARAAVTIQSSGSGPTTDTVGLVELREFSEDLVPAFCGIAATVVGLIGDNPAPGAVRAALRHVVRLFEPRPGRRGSVLGLWGELLTILIAVDAEAMVESWHVDIDDRFDFAAPAGRLEVKTTDSGRRVHEFSNDQLRPVDGATTQVVSIMTTATSAGTSVGDLVGEVQEHLAGRVDLAMKVWQTVAETLGDDWMPTTASLRWDRTHGEQSARLLAAERVPHIRELLDPAIESVRIRVSCEDVPALDQNIAVG